jgi:hypothetical protein
LESGGIQAYFVIAPDYLETRRIDLMHLKKPGGNAIRQAYDFLQINLLSDRPADIAFRASYGTEVIVRSLDGKRTIPGGGPTFGLIMPLLISFAFIFLMLMSSGFLMQAVVDENCRNQLNPTRRLGCGHRAGHPPGR